ncbi:magnesium-dependent phosphatase 1-like protein [Dinothrombium tinctorium]|uniref:Magnesium-dependent phosphatase 1-like protein n=1 Tax=Dinothrombium tinctorium TaxID=1965070 RepID=A0A443R3F8_9ACAR|nr:magnesium-dependent phosphatase 1-like protein [Dinothrombium tinctorium]
MRTRLATRLIVFDLDHTLWPFGVDTFVFKPPYSSRDGKVYDATGARMQYFPQTPEVLSFVASKGIEMGVASRTEYPEGALRLLQLFGFDKLFKYKEVYPGSKIAHFNQFKLKSGFAFEQMAFFDDEQRNIDDIAPLGVTAVLIDYQKGVTIEDVSKTLNAIENRNQ